MKTVRENQRRNGRIRGTENAKTDHLQTLDHIYGPYYGRLNGLRNVETGHIQALGRIPLRDALENWGTGREQ
jgi:hypothetical protein